jgi:Endomembrane protein 70
MFSGPMVATFSVLNTIAIAYRSTQALPFSTIFLIIVLWALITFPLTVLGGVMAKNAKVRCFHLCAPSTHATAGRMHHRKAAGFGC